jgi:hypothetical protein
MTAASGLPNHFLNFDGVLWQHFANQRKRFYIDNPPVCTIVAIKGPILKFKTVGEPLFKPILPS